MSMNGITINPMMMNVGSTTPACHGAKNTSISWSPRKYQGAFEGFGVRVGLAGSSRGAATRSAQTSSSRVMTMAHRNSDRTRNGQACTLSSPGPVAFLIGTSTRLPGTAPSGVFASGVAIASVLLFFFALRRPPRRPEEQHKHEREEERQGHHALPRGQEREDHQNQRDDRVLELRRHRRPQRAGPENPSRRMRQKCTVRNRLVTSGMKMQCRMEKRRQGCGALSAP